jgi:hypothetical protein
MTLPSSGPLSLQQINAEFGRGTNLNAYRGTTFYYPNNVVAQTFPTSPISFSNFYGTQPNSPVVPGSQTFSSAGSNTFTVPYYNNLTITLWGAGASGGSGYGGAGQNGGDTLVYAPAGTLTAGGGFGGSAGFYRRGFGAGGAGGNASGGNTTNTNGNAGTTGATTQNGGSAPNGGAGGTQPYFQVGNYPGGPGSAPGGGGAGGLGYDSSGNPNWQGGGGGGSGAYVQSVYNYTSGPTFFSVISFSVGAGGYASGSGTDGGSGANGRVTFSWS